MTDQMAQDVQRSSAALSEIIAEVIWTVRSRPPEVVLSFQGLHEPTKLWGALRAIGWIVPAMPPRPANAIEWTPDPVAGTDFTVLPWKVNEFVLEEGPWNVAADAVGDYTLDALYYHQAEIVGTSDQITAHAAAYQHRELVREAAAQNPVQVAAPARVAEPQSTPDSGAGFRTIVLLGFAVDNDPLPGAGTWVGVTGQETTKTYWNEFSLTADQAIPGHQEMAQHVAGGALAWYADTDAPLAETAPAGKKIARVILPGLSAGDAKVHRLHKLLGDDVQTDQLRPLVGANASAVLVSATVDGNSFEMLRSNLALRVPNAIFRSTP